MKRIQQARVITDSSLLPGCLSDRSYKHSERIGAVLICFVFVLQETRTKVSLIQDIFLWYMKRAGGQTYIYMQRNKTPSPIRSQRTTLMFISEHTHFGEMTITPFQEPQGGFHDGFSALTNIPENCRRNRHRRYWDRLCSSGSRLTTYDCHQWV